VLLSVCIGFVASVCLSSAENKKSRIVAPKTFSQVFCRPQLFASFVRGSAATPGFVGQLFSGFIFPGTTLIKRAELNASLNRKVSIRAVSRLHSPQHFSPAELYIYIYTHSTNNEEGRSGVELQVALETHLNILR